MTTGRKFLQIFVVAVLSIGALTISPLCLAGVHEAAEGPGGPPFPNDAGPAQIDVSNYPPGMQANYRIFARRCSQCHTLARAINSQYLQLTHEEQKDAMASQPEIMWDRKIWHVDDNEWAGVAVKMHGKPGAAIRIHPAELDKVIEFLVYDSKIRKTGANGEAWRAQRQKLLDGFKKTHPERYTQLFATSE